MSTLDLKPLAKKCKFKADGLGSLSKEVLQVELEHKKRCKITHEIHQKWADDTLNDDNINYAANDALAAIEIFKKFQEILSPSNEPDNPTKGVQLFIDEHCKSFMKNQPKAKKQNKDNANK